MSHKSVKKKKCYRILLLTFDNCLLLCGSCREDVNSVPSKEGTNDRPIESIKNDSTRV